MVKISQYDDNNQVFCESTKTKSKLKVETFCQCNAILKYYLELTLHGIMKFENLALLG